MRKAIVVTALAGVLAVLAGTVTTTASATYTPSSAPYTQTGNNTILTNLLNLPDTIPAAPSPQIPHTTYPAAWNDGATTMTRARMAARVLPALRVLGTIGLGATAAEVGWKIGTAAYLHLVAPAFEAPAGSITLWKWQWSTNGYPSNYCPGGGTTDVGGCFKVQANTTTLGGRVRYPPTGAPNTSDATVNLLRDKVAPALAATGATLWPAANGRTINDEFGVTGSSVVVSLTQSEDGLATLTGLRPSTSTEYAGSAQQVDTSPYTPPTLTTTDLANARAVMGGAVAGWDATDGRYEDASGNPLTVGQVVAQVDTNCRLDSSYCAGGANDPVAGPLADTMTMPNCVGLSYTACTSALTAAGFTGTAAYTQLTLTTADVTRPAGQVITQPVPATTTQPKTGTLTFTRNPDVMPVLLPQPELNETYDQYKARLITLGWLGVATYVQLSDAAADTQLGPDAPVRVRVTTTTGAQTLAPFAWPLPLPRIDPNADISIDRNPADLAPASEPPPVPGSGGSGGTCSCPPIDLAPLTQATPSAKFPFGVFTWLADVLDVFDVAPIAPRFNIHMSASVGGVGLPNYAGDLEFLDDYMAVIRTMLSWALWIGAVWFVGTRLLGFMAAGDASEAADDGSVL